MVARIPVLVITALLVAGCGGSNDEGASSNAATTATIASTGSTASGDALEGASTAPVVWESGSDEIALLDGVRAAPHEGYDRIVFQFRNDVPGYDVRYVERPVLADGSGVEVEVAGGAVLLVRMEPALDADLTQESAPPTYTGPARLAPDTTAVSELVRTGGFESVLTWAVGLDEKRPFRITRLERPARIVIDVTTG